jgi:hypothetical protein
MAYLLAADGDLAALIEELAELLPAEFLIGGIDVPLAFEAMVDVAALVASALAGGPDIQGSGIANASGILLIERPPHLLQILDPRRRRNMDLVCFPDIGRVACY